VGVPATPRQLKVLETVVGSEERRHAVLRAALASSGSNVFPEDLEMLLHFVRAHLVPALTAQVGGRLATVVLTDIDAAIKKELRKREKRATASSSAPPESSGVQSRPRPMSSSPPSSDPRSEDWPVSQDLSSQVPSSVRRRTSVLVIDRDRVGASMLARGMLHSGCEVAVVDPAGIHMGLDPDVIVLAERDAVEMTPALRGLLSARPQAALLVRVGDPRRPEPGLHALATRRYATISRTAPTLELVGLARQLASA
jgi:hypothetical protein